MVARVLDAEKESAVVRLYKNGLSTTKIALHVGCCRNTIRNYLILNDIQRRSASESKRKYALDETFFDIIDTEEKAYWLGFIAADGCVHGNSLVVALHERDENHLKKLAVTLSTDRPLYRRPHHEHGGVMAMLSIRSQRLTDSLKSHGIVERKTHILKPWNGPTELMSHYWRGLFDGDGSIGVGKYGTWNFSLVGTIDICRGFADFILSGGSCNLNVRSHKSIYEARCHGVDVAQRSMSVIYNNASVYLDRKKDLFDKLMATPLGTKSKRLGRQIECRGVFMRPVEWSKLSGVSANNIIQRIDKYGWSAERAIFEIPSRS